MKYLVLNAYSRYGISNLKPVLPPIVSLLNFYPVSPCPEVWSSSCQVCSNCMVYPCMILLYFHLSESSGRLKQIYRDTFSSLVIKFIYCACFLLLSQNSNLIGIVLPQNVLIAISSVTLAWQLITSTNCICLNW